MADGRTLKDGTKDDTEKNRLDLLPFDALEDIGLVYTIGARKYAERNWEKGISYMRVVGALLRHLFAWIKGTTFDKDNGQRHISAVAWNAIALVAYELRGMNGGRFDDRPFGKDNHDETNEDEQAKAKAGRRTPHSLFDSATDRPGEQIPVAGEQGLPVYGGRVRSVCR